MNNNRCREHGDQKASAENRGAWDEEQNGSGDLCPCQAQVNEVRYSGLGEHMGGLRTEGEAQRLLQNHQTQSPVQDAQCRRETTVIHSRVVHLLRCHFFFSGIFFSEAVLSPERRLISLRLWLALESRSR